MSSQLTDVIVWLIAAPSGLSCDVISDELMTSLPLERWGLEAAGGFPLSKEQMNCAGVEPGSRIVDLVPFAVMYTSSMLGES
jgi:hypothetical protein